MGPRPLYQGGVTVSVLRGGDDYLPSTTWAWKRVKIKGPSHPEGIRTSEASSAPAFRRTRAQNLPLSVTYRGGEEASWLVRKGETTVRIPGWMAFHDAMRAVVGELEWPR